MWKSVWGSLRFTRRHLIAVAMPATQHLKRAVCWRRPLLKSGVIIRRDSCRNEQSILRNSLIDSWQSPITGSSDHLVMTATQLQKHTIYQQHFLLKFGVNTTLSAVRAQSETHKEPSKILHTGSLQRDFHLSLSANSSRNDSVPEPRNKW